MIINLILAVVGIISGIIILISTVGFVYFMITASKYSSRKEANKFFGSYMLNNSLRYMLAFVFLMIAAMSLAIGFITSFITAFFLNPLSVWEVAGIISIANLAAFFVTFTSIDHPKQFLNYIRFLKKKA